MEKPVTAPSKQPETPSQPTAVTVEGRRRDHKIGLMFQYIARLRNRYFDKLVAPHDLMEKNGWVVRKPDPQDRRSNRVWLTEAGRAKKPVLEEGFAHLNDVAFAGLSDAEVAALVEALRKVRLNLENACQD